MFKIIEKIDKRNFKVCFYNDFNGEHEENTEILHMFKIDELCSTDFMEDVKYYLYDNGKINKYY